MPLKSQLFGGDPDFEKCLTDHAAHITPGARGFHVAKIQWALMVLDRPILAQAELNASIYGPSTTNSVLAYKRKRGIINFSYQTQADNIVGKMTIARMDAEMFLAEKRGFLMSFVPAKRK